MSVEIVGNPEKHVLRDAELHAVDSDFEWYSEHVKSYTNSELRKVFRSFELQLPEGASEDIEEIRLSEGLELFGDLSSHSDPNLDYRTWEVIADRREALALSAEQIREAAALGLEEASRWNPKNRDREDLSRRNRRLETARLAVELGLPGNTDFVTVRETKDQRTRQIYCQQLGLPEGSSWKVIMAHEDYGHYDWARKRAIEDLKLERAIISNEEIEEISQQRAHHLAAVLAGKPLDATWIELGFPSNEADQVLDYLCTEFEMPERVTFKWYGVYRDYRAQLRQMQNEQTIVVSGMLTVSEFLQAEDERQDALFHSQVVTELGLPKETEINELGPTVREYARKRRSTAREAGVSLGATWPQINAAFVDRARRAKARQLNMPASSTWEELR